MEIIKTIEDNIYDIIGHQRFDSTVEYVESQYVVKEKSEDGEEFWHNTFTGEIISIKTNEVLDTEYLVKHWWLFEKTIDQYSYARFIYKQCIRDKNYNELKLRNGTYIIVTTTACNANCWYCYEKGQKIQHMTKETSLDVAKFIKDRYTTPVCLSWFGGEPLVNREPIDTICNYLFENDVVFTSDMTTNGYLLDTITDYDLLFRWKVSHMQISLDGYGDKYNSVKQYNDYDINVPGTLAPYDRIVNAISHLLDLEIKISIRCNVSCDNKEDILELIDHLTRTLGRRKGLNIYAHELFDIQYTDEQTDQMFKNLMCISNRLSEDCYYPHVRSGSGMRTQCMADAGIGYVITPSGDLSLCEHYVAPDSAGIVGNIYTNHFDGLRELSWSYYPSDEELCRTCKNYPCCMRLAKCPACRKCTPAIADYMNFILSLNLRKKINEVKKHELQRVCDCGR